MISKMWVLDEELGEVGHYYALYPGFAGFTLKRRTGHFPGYFKKRGTLGELFFNVPPVCEKRRTLGVLFFNVPPVCEKRGTLKISTPNVPRFSQTGRTLKNSPPNVPRFMKYPAKCPVLLLRVKPAKPGYNRFCQLFL